MATIILASNNKNKLAELKKAVNKYNFEVKTLEEIGLEEPNEDGCNFEENALIKARAAFAKTKCPTLADDSGFCVYSVLNSACR